MTQKAIEKSNKNEQYSWKSNIKFSVSEKKGENLFQVLNDALQEVGINLEENNIVAMHRPKRQTKTHSSEDAKLVGEDPYDEKKSRNSRWDKRMEGDGPRYQRQHPAYQKTRPGRTYHVHMVFQRLRLWTKWDETN